jgi:sulfofructose kinase
MIYWDILGIGAAAVDDLLYIDRFPEPDTKIPIRSEQRQGGGLTATAMVAASRLGAKTAYLAILGDDDLSRFTIQELEREGVDCSAIIRRPQARPFHSRVVVDQATGERIVLYSATGVTFLGPGDASDELIGSCRVLFLDQYGGRIGSHALNVAKSQGIPVVADVERIVDSAGEALLERADHLIIGIAMGRQVTGLEDPAAIVEALARPDRACCTVTAGALGCWYAQHNGPIQHFPAFQVPVVDTTGCGDVFHGAYAASIARRESVDRAIEVGSATAALKAMQPGGRSGIPDRADVEKFLEAASKNKEILGDWNPGGGR